MKNYRIIKFTYGSNINNDLILETDAPKEVIVEAIAKDNSSFETIQTYIQNKGYYFDYADFRGEIYFW